MRIGEIMARQIMGPDFIKPDEKEDIWKPVREATENFVKALGELCKQVVATFKMLINSNFSENLKTPYRKNKLHSQNRCKQWRRRIWNRRRIKQWMLKF